MKINIKMNKIAVMVGVALSTSAMAQFQLPPSSLNAPPAAKQYLPYGSTVPAMVVTLANGTTYDNRTDRKRVAHFWKTYAHRDVPVGLDNAASYGADWVSTARNLPSNWTGKTAGCVAGKIDTGIQEAALRQSNWYRAMVGLAPAKNGGVEDREAAQLAALVNFSGYPLGLGNSHDPGPVYPCYSIAANAAAGRASLGFYISTEQRGPGMIDALIDDAGAINAGVGHRNVQTLQFKRTFAYGETAEIARVPGGFGMVVQGTSTLTLNYTDDAAPAGPSEILWPSPGFVPFDTFPRISGRWSMACPGCDFTGATVTVKRNGVATGVTIEPDKSSISWQPILVWRVTGVDYVNFSPRSYTPFLRDDVFDTTIAYKRDGVAAVKSYRTTVFNPEVDVAFSPTFDLTDMYWNANESGWGVKLIQGVDGNLFGAVYFYDDAGNPRWMTMQGSWTAAGVFTGKLYTTRGPGFNAVPFNPRAVVSQEVGTGSLTFAADTQTVRFDFAMEGKVGVKNLERYSNVPEGYRDATNYRGMWWNANESGWGLTVQHYFNNLFVAWFTYSPDGSPLWVTMQGGWIDATTYEGKLYQTKQAPWNPAAFDPKATTVREVGVAKLVFTEFNRATFDYTLNGVKGTKAVERFEF